jgi:histidinol-phosphate aminotransferase
VSAAQRLHGGADALGAALHDFSTNANACGPCPQALAAVQGADATRYPDPAYAALREALAGLHGVAAARIVPAASASELIFRLTAWVASRGGRRVALPAHGYGDYAAAAQAWGMAQVDAAQADLAWACDPSSPLGASEALVEGPGVNVLDRAYEPLRLSGEAPAAQRLDHSWQLWTPNKALGLSGVRGAYAIAPVDADTQPVQALAPSWPIGAHGVAMLLAWCSRAVQDWVRESLATLRGWKTRQIAICQDLGWACLPSDANFFVARLHGSRIAPGMTDHLRTRGIKLRDCASFGLPGHVRLGVLAPASQDALREALQ